MSMTEPDAQAKKSRATGGGAEGGGAGCDAPAGTASSKEDSLLDTEAR